MDSTSAQVIIDVKPDGGVEFMRREQTSGGSEFIAGGTTSFPAYLSLAVSGGPVSGFICNASGHPGVLTTAVFGSVAVSVAR